MDSPLIQEGLNQLESSSPFTDLRLFVLFFSAAAAAAAAVAAVAAVGILFSKIQVLRLRRGKSLIRIPSFYSFSDGEDDASASSSDGEEEEESEKEEEEQTEKFLEAKGSEMGNFSFSPFSLADLVGGMSVVKAWDGLGRGFDRRGGGDFSLFDLSRGEIVRSFTGGGDVPVVKVASPAEIMSAADEAGGCTVLKVWDARADDESPAATAHAVLRHRVAKVASREEKVFVGDDEGEVAELDLRNLRAQVEGGDGLGSWWRNAARCLTSLSPRLDMERIY